MIDYSKGFLGLPSLTHWHGSVLPRAAIPAIFSAFATTLTRFIGDQTEDLSHDGTFSAYGQGAFQSLNFVVGFMVIYRAQQAYARYWQGRMAFQKMSAYWGSAFIHTCSFAKCAPHREPMKTAEDILRDMQREESASKVESFFGVAINEAGDWHASKRMMASRVVHRMCKWKPHARCFDEWKGAHAISLLSLICLHQQPQIVLPIGADML